MKYLFKKSIVPLFGFFAFFFFSASELQARQYDPGQGRFISRDPIGYVDGMNRYSYVGNMPFKYSDPFGLKKSSVNGNANGDWEIEQTLTNAKKAGESYSSYHKVTFKTKKGACCCDEIAFIQIVRVIDATTGKNVDPDLKPGKGRADENGWEVDRFDHRKDVWYGYGDLIYDPKTDTMKYGAGGNVQTGWCKDKEGKDKRDAWMWDTPSWDRVNTKFEFEVCAVCKEGEKSGTIYGCVTLGFTVDKNGKIKAHGITSGKKSKNFDSAIGAWNTNEHTVGNHNGEITFEN